MVTFFVDRIREKLAAYAHEAWSGWMRYLFEKGTFNDDGTWTMPAWAVDRWKRQMNTAYQDLPENEKESDRKEADTMIDILRKDNLEMDAVEDAAKYYIED